MNANTFGNKMILEICTWQHYLIGRIFGSTSQDTAAYNIYVAISLSGEKTYFYTLLYMIKMGSLQVRNV